MPAFNWYNVPKTKPMPSLPVTQDRATAALGKASSIGQGSFTDRAQRKISDVFSALTGIGEAPPAMAAGAALTAPGQIVWHGTGAPKFNKFDLSYVGNPKYGEGNTAYGHGIYLAGNPEIAQEYFNSHRKVTGGSLKFRGAKGDIESSLANSSWTSLPDSYYVGQGEKPLTPSRFSEVDRNNRLEALRSLNHYSHAGYDNEIDIPVDLAYNKTRKALANVMKMERYERKLSGNFSPRYLTESSDRRFKNISDQGKYLKRIKSYLEHPPAFYQGGVLKVDLPDDAISNMLLWDEPLYKQPSSVRQFMESKFKNSYRPPGAEDTGELLYGKVAAQLPDDPRYADSWSWARQGSKVASQTLREAGVPGIKYLNGVSRNRNYAQPRPENYNYVSFSDEIPKILDYYDWNKLKGMGGFR